MRRTAFGTERMMCFTLKLHEAALIEGFFLPAEGEVGDCPS